jgi:hypothetical protein
MPSSGACSTETSTTSSRSASTSWKKGHKYLTLVYQLDAGCRRLLWIGRDRTAKTFGEFFDFLGPERSAKLEFVVSDMWKAFLSASRTRASQAVHVLDRFHVVKLLNKGIDEVRRAEARELRAKGDSVTLKHTRWLGPTLWVSFCYSPSVHSNSVRRFLGDDNLARDVQVDGSNTLTFIERAGGSRPGCMVPCWSWSCPMCSKW